MIGIVERGVPECDDGVAHVFVDGALSVENGVGHRRQIFVEETGELRGVEPFRDGGERSDVAEEQGQLSLQAAKLEGARHFREARDHRGRDKSAKGRPDLPLLMTLDRVERRDPGKIDRGGGKCWISRLDEQSVTGKREPADRDDRANDGREHQRREVGGQDPGRRHERRAHERRRHPLRARGPVRPRERLAAQELLNDLRMGFNARHRGRQRGRDDVGEQGCGRSDEHDRAAKIAEIRAGSESFPRRDRAPGIGTREIYPNVSSGVGVNRQIAVANRQDAIHLSESRLSAGVGRFDDIGRGALGDAERLHGETWVKGAVHVEDERHAPHDPVGVRAPIEEADAGGVLREFRERREGPGRRRQELRCVVACSDESRFDRAAGAVGRVGDEAPKDDWRAVDRPGEGAVGRLGGRRAGVGAVLLRKQEIEGDRRSPGAFQRLDKRGKALARPWPLPEPLERFVVDCDDADGLVERVRPRLPTLILVEDQILHHRPRRRADDASKQRERANSRRGQCVKSGLVRSSHAVLAARRAAKIEKTPVLSSR